MKTKLPKVLLTKLLAFSLVSCSDPATVSSSSGSGSNYKVKTTKRERPLPV